MGSFFTSLHVRSATTEDVCKVLPELTEGRAYVSPEAGGWVTVYAEASEGQNNQCIQRIAGGLSRALGTDVLGFLVHDSDVAAYWLYRKGRLEDQFNSAREYFGGRGGGSAEELLPLCHDGATLSQINAVLHPTDGFPLLAEEIISRLAHALGINETRACLGFDYFHKEGEELLPDASRFEPIGEGAERKKAAQPAEPGERTARDIFALAISMLTQAWNTRHAQQICLLAEALGREPGAALKQMWKEFDESARNSLKHSRLPNVPGFESLIRARDEGPDALAALIAAKTPEHLPEIGVAAAGEAQEKFLAALLKNGLDPKAADRQGRTTVAAAEQHGKNSGIYRVIKGWLARK